MAKLERSDFVGPTPLEGGCCGVVLVGGSGAMLG